MHGTTLARRGRSPSARSSSPRRAPATTSPTPRPTTAAPSGSGDEGTVHISGQNFPEAALVAAMYDELLTDAGYDTDVKLVDTRDVYMQTFPERRRRRAGVRRRHRRLPQHHRERRRRRSRSRPPTAQESIASGQEPARRAGHHPARPVGGHRHQRLLRDPGVLRVRGRHHAVRPRGQDRRARRGARLRGPRSTARAACPTTTASTSPRCCRSGYASDQTYQSVIDGESQLGETSTTDGTLESQGLVLLEDDKQIQPAQNLVPGGQHRVPRRAPGRRRRPQRADGGADHREAHRAQRPRSPSTGRSPRTSPTTSSPRRAWSRARRPVRACAAPPAGPAGR